MKLDEMKVQYDKSRDGFTRESSFEVKKEKPLPKININGIAVKVGLCAGVLALAFIVRAFGVGAPKQQSVAEVNAHSDGTGEQNEDSVPGKLKYVEASASKWAAPVRSTDIELMREGQMLRFTAGATDVLSCMDGRVLSVGTDETFGECVRVQSETDCEAFYYGFERIAVKEGDTVKAGDTLGTVALGRSLYMKVYQSGAPQDPTAYVDLSLKGE
ncbi:MAG: M23 family metallopeptidase [Clostridia bacterium]|nr:M23 family metallopeptidase [Clostridia bacterium]